MSYWLLFTLARTLHSSTSRFKGKKSEGVGWSLGGVTLTSIPSFFFFFCLFSFPNRVSTTLEPLREAKVKLHSVKNAQAASLTQSPVFITLLFGREIGRLGTKKWVKNSENKFNCEEGK
jgi:hypothetical protein